MKSNKIDILIIFIVSFFLYSGYYVGLMFFYNARIPEISRLYSIPLRLVLFVLMTYYVIKNFARLQNNKAVYLLLSLFSFLYIVKVIYTASIGASTAKSWYEYIFFYLSYALMPFLFYSAVNFIRYKSIILNALIFSGFLLGIYTIYTFGAVLSSGGVGRLSMLTYETGEAVISPLALAYSGAITILLSVYRIMYEKARGIKLLYYIVTIILSFTMFFLGATRGALLVVLLGSLAFVYFGNLKRKLIFIVLFVIAIPFIIYGVELTGSAIFDRATSTIETGDASGRELLWAEAYQEFTEYPILGGRIEVSGVYPHNIFLEILMATGIVGFLLFVPILIILFRGGYLLLNNSKIHFYFIPMLIFIWGISQHMVTGALWSAITLFTSLGMFNSNSASLVRFLKFTKIVKSGVVKSRKVKT